MEQATEQGDGTALFPESCNRHRTNSYELRCEVLHLIHLDQSKPLFALHVGQMCSDRLQASKELLADSRIQEPGFE